MAAAHNTFIQGINAIIHHGPTVPADKVQPFMVFCLALVRALPQCVSYFPCSFFPISSFQLDNIHHHHSLEETFYFPAMEEKLGKGALDGNVEEHKLFMPGLEAFEEWCKKVQKGEVPYDAKVFLGLVEAFADIMVAHMNSVRSYLHSLETYYSPLHTHTQEIPTLDRNIMQEKFTIAELKAIDGEFMKRALATVDFYKTLPLSVVCANPSTPWWVPSFF